MEFKQWIETKAPKVFFILITIQLVYLVALFIVDIFKNILPQQSDTTSIERDEFYKWTILFVFQMSDYYYAWNAILMANVLELFAFLIIEIATFGATTVKFVTTYNDIALATFNYLYLAYAASILILSCICYKPFYDVFLYRNIMKVGAALEAQRQYQNYTYFNALVKLYFQVSMCSFVTFFYFIDYLHWWLYFVDLIVIVLQFVSFFFGYRGLRLEIQNYLYIYAGLISTIQLYVLGKTIYFVVHYMNNQSLFDNGQLIDIYTVIIIATTNLVCIVILAMDFYYLVKCQEGFGKGLKETLLKSQLQYNEPNNYADEEYST